MRGLDMAPAMKQSKLRIALKRVYVDPSEVLYSASGSEITSLCEKDNSVASVHHHGREKEAKAEDTVSKMTDAVNKSDDTIKGTKRKAEAKLKGAAKPTKKGRGKDPNEPKKPASDFFVFMESFRKIYKDANPQSKGVAAVSKAGGERWKQMSDEEKAPYKQEADARKDTYDQDVKKYHIVKDVAAKEAAELSDAAAEDEEEHDEKMSFDVILRTSFNISS